jgi:hypothetical protein
MTTMDALVGDYSAVRLRLVTTPSAALIFIADNGREHFVRSSSSFFFFTPSVFA